MSDSKEVHKTNGGAAQVGTDGAGAGGSGAPAVADVGQSSRVRVRGLSFQYSVKTPFVLRDISFELGSGQRLLLIGDNGAGKTTLLRVLSGRHLYSEGDVTILGRDTFHDTTLNFERVYMGCDWGRRTVAFAGYGCPIQADVKVSDMMKDVQAAFPERKAMLVKLLGVNLEWRMHQVSDGQRRRVQIFLQLLRPSRVLLLDEITTDLDVITRADFLEYLRRDSVENGTTIIYATHIFDGLNDWFTHLAYMNDGTVTRYHTRDNCEDFLTRVRSGETSPLLKTVEGWLRQDKERRAREAAAKSTIPRDEAEPAAGGDSTSMALGLGNGFAPGRFYDYYG